MAGAATRPIIAGGEYEDDSDPEDGRPEQLPDLVVIYLGMRVNRLAGIKTLFGFGPKISASVEAQPDGLLLHENVVWSLFPPHAGMRQYWRDFESLERWARSKPHQLWWQNFVRNSGGTAFWHETYLMRGGMEAVYDDLPMPYRDDEVCTGGAGARVHVQRQEARCHRRSGAAPVSGQRGRALRR